jgi:hypothetical protein
MEDATSGRSRKPASEDNITTCTVLYEVTASIKDIKKKMAFSHLSLDARTWVRFHVTPCKIFGTQIFTGTGFSSGTSGFRYQYYSTTVPHLFLSTSCSYQKEKQAIPEKITTSNAFPKIGENLIFK